MSVHPTTGGPKRRILYQELRRPEAEEMVKAKAVVIIPVGSIEQHGPHLPLDTDSRSVYDVAIRAAEKVTEFPVLVAPPVWWGSAPHHMAFCGTINLAPELLAELLVQITRSLHHHGFDRMLLLNGHGGNRSIVDFAALKLGSEGIVAASANYFSMIARELREIGESEIGGMSHSCEMETSMMLELRPDLVDMSSAVKNLKRPKTSFFSPDMRQGGTVYYRDDFGKTAPDGVKGDPLLATREKGERILEAAADRVAAFVREFRAMEVD